MSGKGSRIVRSMRRNRAFEFIYHKKGKRSMADIPKDKRDPQRSKELMRIYWKHVKKEVKE